MTASEGQLQLSKAELAKRNEIFQGELQAIKKDLLQRVVDLEEENLVVKEENTQIVEEVKRLQAQLHQLEGPANISESEARGSRLRTILKFESPGSSAFGQTPEVDNHYSRAYLYSPGAPGGPERQSLETRFADEARNESRDGMSASTASTVTR